MDTEALVCCGLWGRKESETTQWLNWTCSIVYIYHISFIHSLINTFIPWTLQMLLWTLGCVYLFKLVLWGFFFRHHPGVEFLGHIYGSSHFQFFKESLYYFLIQWTWTWVNSGRWWETGRPGVLQSMGLQRVRHNLVTEQQHTIFPSDCTNFHSHQQCIPFSPHARWVFVIFFDDGHFLTGVKW